MRSKNIVLCILASRQVPTTHSQPTTQASQPLHTNPNSVVQKARLTSTVPLFRQRLPLLLHSRVASENLQANLLHTLSGMRTSALRHQYCRRKVSVSTSHKEIQSTRLHRTVALKFPARRPFTLTPYISSDHLSPRRLTDGTPNTGKSKRLQSLGFVPESAEAVSTARPSATK